MMTLGIIGFLGFFVCVILTIISAVKKNGKAKFWGISIAVCFVLFIVGAVGSSEDTPAETTSANAATNSNVYTSTAGDSTKSAGTQEQTTELSEPEPAAEPTTEDEEVDNQYITDGMYKVGSDLQAGEYIIYSDSFMSYFQISKDSTGSLDSILANDTFDGTRYVTVEDGQYLELKAAKMLPIDKAPIQEPVDGKYMPGMYKVGRDIKAGEYKVVPDTNSLGSYVEVSKDSLHNLESIITNDILSGEKYITIKDGQYIKLVGCYLK